MTIEAYESEDFLPSFSIGAVSFSPLTSSGLVRSSLAVAKTTTTVERDYVSDVLTVVLSGTPDTAVSITFPSGEVRTGTIVDGTLTIQSSPGEAALGSIVITTTLPSGSIQTQTITFNVDGSITVSGTGAAPGASAGASFQNGSTSTTAAAAGTYTMTSAASQPLGAFSIFLTVGGYMSFKPLAVAGGSPTGTLYAQGIVSFAPMTVSAHGLEGNTQANMREAVASYTAASFYFFVDVEIDFGATAGMTMASLVLLDAEFEESADVSATMLRSAVMQALMDTDIQVFAGIPIYSEDGEVWVVNDESGASMMYENYGFNSFALINGHYYGAKSNGVFLLEGATDAGSNIRASISFGTHDFGSTERKNVPNCYVGLSSDGVMVLKITANGTEYLYRTVRSNDYTQTQRIKPGKGIRATHLTFELFNEAGCDFDLDSIEFEPAVLSRRV